MGWINLWFDFYIYSSGDGYYLIELFKVIGFG